MSDELPLVSIVIPVHNHAKAKICIQHVKKQTYPHIEVISVISKGFPAEKRNYGYMKSSGNYVLFLDEDEYLSSTAIAASVRKFEEGYDMVAMQLVKSRPQAYIAKCVSATRIMDVKPLFFRRQVLEAAGGFRPEFVFNDDAEISLRVLARGFRQGMVNLEEGYIFHDETNTLGSVFRKTLLARRSWRNLQKEYGLMASELPTRTQADRRRIFGILKQQPHLFLGSLFVIITCFVIRRIP